MRCIRLACPICGKEYGISGQCQDIYSARDNLAQHIRKTHHRTREEARALLVEAGIAREGQDIRDAIRDYDRMVAEGVIVE